MNNNIFRLIFILAILLFGFTDVAFSWNGEPWGNITSTEIRNRANSAINQAWTPSRTFTNFCYSGYNVTYYAGTTYYGQAYSMSNPVESPAEFLNSVNSIPSSGAYKYLGNDCSGFVSYNWKLPARYTTSDFGSQVNGSYFVSLGGKGSGASAGLRFGDALNNAGSHIIMVESVSSSGGVNSMEQTPTRATKRYWSWSSLASYQPIRRRQIVDSPTPPSPPPPPSSGAIHVTYQTYDDVSKKWLPNVTDTQDYAGIYGHDVDAIYANLSQGNITYKVHYKGGGWLPAVTNRSDYAGMYNYPIDGLMMTTNTGKTIHYRVHLRRTGVWLPYVTGYNSNDPNNGYAGTLGQEIDAVQIYLQ